MIPRSCRQTAGERLPPRVDVNVVSDSLDGEFDSNRGDERPSARRPRPPQLPNADPRVPPDDLGGDEDVDFVDMPAVEQ